MSSIVPFVLEGIWAYKLTSLLEGDEDGRSGRARAETRRAGMKTDMDANWRGSRDSGRRWPGGQTDLS